MKHLIDKDKLIDEIQQIIADEEESIRTFEHRKNQSELQRYNARIELLNYILSFIDTLEMKKVDLNAAVERYVEQHKSEFQGYFDIRRIARHFFELGLAQKGE